MPPVVKPTRFAHAEGHTDVCYDPTGRYLVTCGSDGEVRTWEGFQDDEPKSYSVGESALAVACGGDTFFVAVDSYCVKAFEVSTGQETSVAARFPSDIYAVACSKDGKTLVAGSGDFTLKVVDVLSGTSQLLTGHTAPVLCCCIDPRAEFIASSSCDGSARVWTLSDQSCVKTWHAILPKSNDFRTSKVLGRLAWSPSGDKLAVPAKSEVRLVPRGSWDQVEVLAHDSIQEALSIVAFSGCGKLLAAATRGGQLLVWDSSTRQLMHTLSCGEDVCSLSWNPRQKELVYCNAQGQLGLVEGIESGSSKEQVPPPVTKAMPEERVDGEDDGIDLGQIKATYEPLIFGDSDAEEEDTAVVPSAGHTAPVQPEYRPRLVQDAFQPGSTPVHLQHRFMVWNSVGMVRAHNTAEESSIDVEFHDTSVHHALHRGNTQGHTMAALSEKALVLAGPQQLECLHLGSWDANKEWAVDTLSDGIQAVAVGDDWVAACCSSGLVRLWTLSGLQKAVWRAPGPVVALVASGRSLALIFHQGAGVTAEWQALAVVQYNVGAGVLEPPIPVPLAERQRLAWAGYTDEGSLCTVDSDGVLSILGSSYGWNPVCNTRDNVKSQSDHYFVLGVSETRQQVRALMCKGSRYPPTLPRPVMVVLDFSLPFLGTDSEKGRLEEELWRAWCLEDALRRVGEEGRQLADVCNRRQLLLLKLFALAAKAEREVRALDVARLMDSERLIQGAVEYASKSRRLVLAQRVERLLLEQEPQFETAPAARQDFQAVPSMRKRDPDQAEEVVIKPKPLQLSRKRPADVTCKEVLLPTDEHRTTVELPVTRGNPFKVTKSQESPVGESAANGGKPRGDVVASSRQLTLKFGARSEAAPATNATNKSGVQLYMESIRATLLEEEPGLAEDQLVSRAVARFRALSQEERAEWNSRAKRRSPSPVHAAKRLRPAV
ncbi:LOW QUALITY PROTEIN: WD repeat and HMG-box DNA-binding protein 1-like [Dermacentor silvarum]|uniref:LOW QUALITY PROTEIN: WD repeat and HMG-box DNA-binding protein 1-like n=2 Tax=Dermacentor silvarum TaxID=543639 RepID=UPI00189C3438|nr:LOW QUALITY PROTEIN: WD repeat and HMG-box DNA-binding protein 1-like [Dermacentor silvarum]